MPLTRCKFVVRPDGKLEAWQDDDGDWVSAIDISVLEAKYDATFDRILADASRLKTECFHLKKKVKAQASLCTAYRLATGAATETGNRGAVSAIDKIHAAIDRIHKADVALARLKEREKKRREEERCKS